MIHVLGGDTMTILSSVKKSLGITDSMTHFDDVIIMHINTIFVILNQMGVGPDEVFSIEDNYSYWEDFSEDSNMNMVKTYMYLKVKMLFDTPTGSVKEAMERSINELEFRLNAEHEKNVVL